MKIKSKIPQFKTLMRFLWTSALALIISMPLAAQEKSSVKLNLPDGPYLIQGGCGFIIKDNQFYTSPGAIKKFGITKLNEWFAGMKYKNLFAGEIIEEGHFSEGFYDESNLKKVSTCDYIFSKGASKSYPLKKEKIIKGPLYAVTSFAKSKGSVTNAMAVPDKYKERLQKLHKSISSTEIQVVEKLVKEQLFAQLIINAEAPKRKFRRDDVENGTLETLDKITWQDKDMYIGVFSFSFKKGGYDVLFSVMHQKVNQITSYDNLMIIVGALDLDGCGEDELILEKTIPGENAFASWLEIYKRQKDGNWKKIIRSAVNKVEL